MNDQPFVFVFHREKHAELWNDWAGSIVDHSDCFMLWRSRNSPKRKANKKFVTLLVKAITRKRSHPEFLCPFQGMSRGTNGILLLQFKMQSRKQKQTKQTNQGLANKAFLRSRSATQNNTSHSSVEKLWEIYTLAQVKSISSVGS